MKTDAICWMLAALSLILASAAASSLSTKVIKRYPYDGTLSQIEYVPRDGSTLPDALGLHSVPNRRPVATRRRPPFPSDLTLQEECVECPAGMPGCHCKDSSQCEYVPQTCKQCASFVCKEREPALTIILPPKQPVAPSDLEVKLASLDAGQQWRRSREDLRNLI